MKRSPDLYSQLKPAWHEDRLSDLRDGLIPRPVHVHLILSDLCNQDCSFCAYRMSNGLSHELFVGGSKLAKVGTSNPVRMIPTEKAMEIVEDCAAIGVKAIQFTGGGEPTVHPDHLDVIGYAQYLGMETALVTNGVNLHSLVPEVGRLVWIRVSVDAGDAVMYARTRNAPVGHWHKVWKNVGQLIESGYAGALGIGYVVTPGNYEGLASAAVICKELGVSNMRVGAVFSAAGLKFYGDSIPRITEVIQQVKELVDGDGFELVDLFGRRLSDLEHGSPEHPRCYYQYLTMFIGGDLNVYRCCNTAYTSAGRVASLVSARLREIWWEEIASKYEPFDARDCRFCQFLGQNQVIRALVDEPSHVNFV